MCSSNQPEWKRSRDTGGGVLLDLASHHVDLVQHLLGDPVVRVYATTRSLRGEGDHAAVQLELASGAMAQIFVSLGTVDENRMEIVGTEKFENNDVDMVPQLTRLKDKGADVIILVGNAAPGAQVMKARERLSWKVPVVSHWGISGGRFPELTGPTAGEAHFVQTYSFFGKQSPVGERVLAALKSKYPAIKGPGDIFAPIGTANAYDAMHLVALAIEQAKSTDGEAIRAALEDLKTPYQGLIKTYNKPFGATNHDALGPEDYIMVHYEGDNVVPVY